MNTKMMEQFEVMDTEMLAKVEGSFGGWGDMLYGLLGGLAPSPILDQLLGVLVLGRKSYLDSKHHQPSLYQLDGLDFGQVGPCLSLSHP